MHAIYQQHSGQKLLTGRRATGDKGRNEMLKFEDPRRKKRKHTTPTTPREDRFGAKADFSTSRIQPESGGGDSELVRSVRSDARGQTPREGTVVSVR